MNNLAATDMSAPIELDETDQGILALLRQDGRMPYRAIARELDITEPLTAASGAGWRTSTVHADCFGEQGADLGSVTRPLSITVEGSLLLRIGSARLVAAPSGANCEF